MARIIVTGANGLFGCSLVPYLKYHDHEVLSHSRNNGADICVDLTNIDQVKSVLDNASPEIIVNLAAMTNVDECEDSPSLAYLANAKIVDNLVKWIRENDNKCYLVHISTDQVYDGDGPHKEEDVLLSNYYGFSKYAGELLARTVPGTVLRTNFFGKSQCDNKSSFSDWIIQSLSSDNAITVFNDVYFSPLSMHTLAELVRLVIERKEQGVFNIGSKEGMSKADFAFTLADALDLPAKCMIRGTSKDIKLSAYRPKDMRMDSSRFEIIFGVNLPTLKDEIYSMKTNDAI